MGEPHAKQPSHEAFVPASTIELRVQQAWTELGRGVHDRKHGFHLPMLCTLDAQGLPDARVVVLRKAVREQAQVLMHTDVRSDKARLLLGLPGCTGPCTIVFYDAARRLQLRVHGSLTLHTQGALVANQWAASSLSSRRCYLAPHAPGSVQAAEDSNLPEHFRGKVPTPDEARAGKDNFAVLACIIARIDMLHLGAMGHSRCEWHHDETGCVRQERWLSP